jgi:putative transposase
MSVSRMAGAALSGAAPGRNGSIQTGIGPITVQRQKVRDRAADARASTENRFSSKILPERARRSRRRDALPPVLCLRSVSTGDLREALTALPGPEACEAVASRDRTSDPDLAGRL